MALIEKKKKKNFFVFIIVDTCKTTSPQWKSAIPVLTRVTNWFCSNATSDKTTELTVSNKMPVYLYQVQDIWTAIKYQYQPVTSCELVWSSQIDVPSVLHFLSFISKFNPPKKLLWSCSVVIGSK